MKINKVNLQWRGTFKYINNPQYILIHHAEASVASVYDIHQWHLENGWNGIGYQYYVRKDGSIWQGRPENVQGSHCPKYNTNSIGICAEGNFEVEEMSEIQLQNIMLLINDIKNRHVIKEIYGHKEVYQTSCPGKNYPLEQIKKGEIDLKNYNLNANEIIDKVSSNADEWKKCLDALEIIGNTNQVGDLNIADYIRVLIEKVWKYKE